MSNSLATPRLQISQVYSVDMGKIMVRIDGNSEPLSFVAKKIEEDKDTGELVIYDFWNKVIGRFNKHKVVGWWTERD